MNFKALKTAVAAQFELMQKHPMFRVDIDKDTLWNTYLASFPEGSDPIYRKRTEHDCSCCKNFIRTIGNVVAIIDGKLVSVWDIRAKDEPAYNVIVAALSKIVLERPIAKPFLHDSQSAGTNRNFEDLVDGKPRVWEHFFVTIPRTLVMPKAAIPSKLGEKCAARDSLHRALTGEVTNGMPMDDEETDAESNKYTGPIKMEAVDTIIDLIAQDSLYRGTDYKFQVTEFRKVLAQFNELPERERKNFAWEAASKLHDAVSKIRNSSIGKLLVDLSNPSMDMEVAIKKFDQKVAPSNFKRSKALVTPQMVASAKAKLEEMGLLSAVDGRRYATLHDISINNLLFADRDTRKVINGDVFDDLAASASSKIGRSDKWLDKVEEIGIEKFIQDVLPRAATIEVLFENLHSGNLVNLIAPSDPTAGKMFKWDNRFSWSYNGDVADSVRERVKKAGGNVTGDLCCRLAWDNSDDLDFHLVWGNRHIAFNQRYMEGGQLDVDANGMNGIRENPVENIFFANERDLRSGVTYELFVHQYSLRNDKDENGFTAEIDFKGDVKTFVFPRRLRPSEKVVVAKFTYSKAKGIEIIESLPSTTATKTVWNLPTQTFHKVKAVMLSPNYWDGQGIGNKHYFFMMEGCVNDSAARGFYNEFLKSELDPHRKVFEYVGNRVRTDLSTEQLSGIGFSSTQRNTLICRVKGSFSRVLKVKF